MNEHPILFSGAMVRAILADLKSQTRRVVKPQPGEYFLCRYLHTIRLKNGQTITCPYGQTGDRLWVRETFSWAFTSGYDARSDGGLFWYAATDSGECEGPWQPSIFMPRRASRITAEICMIHAERLQQITKIGAIWEGCNSIEDFKLLWDSINAKPKPVYTRDDNGKRHIAYYESFPWDDIHETRTYRGKWWFVIGNPWVWVIEFKRVAA